MNDGTETETDYFGHKDPLDECNVNHLVDIMSEKDSDNQCNRHEYSPPPPGCKVVDLDSFNFSATKSQMVTFGKETFAARMTRHVEGSVALCGGCCSGRICMIETKLYHWMMRGYCSTRPTTI